MKVALIAALIVILIIVAVYYYSQPKFTLYPNINFVNGLVSPGQNSSDGKVVYLGTFTDQASCQNAVAGRSDLYAYTWHTSAAGSYANQCFGLTTKTPTQTVSTSGAHQSGIKESMTNGDINVGTFDEMI